MLTPLAENLWLLAYPMKKLGADMRRNVTLIRLTSGELVIHSTGPFTAEDVALIQTLGKPGWLVEAMIGHDTFAKEGRAAFPDVPYLAPPGFSEAAGVSTTPLLPPPSAWGSELQVQLIEGVPSYQEYVFLHAASRTLITADLVFNFGSGEPAWTKLLLNLAITGDHHPGMSRPFKGAVTDRAAFDKSIATVMAWDFDRVIVGHGDVIATDGKAKVQAALTSAGF